MNQINLRRVDPLDPRPFYLRVASSIRDAIADHTYLAGQRIPSVRDLAGYFQLSAMTISEALKQLANEGLIQPRRGTGWYVVTNDVASSLPTHLPSPLDRKLRLLLQQLRELPDTTLNQIPKSLATIAEMARDIEADLQPSTEQHE